MHLEEEQEDQLVCNYITVLILFATFSITRFPRQWASFIGIVSFCGITYDTVYEIQHMPEMVA